MSFPERVPWLEIVQKPYSIQEQSRIWMRLTVCKNAYQQRYRSFTSAKERTSTLRRRRRELLTPSTCSARGFLSAERSMSAVLFIPAMLRKGSKLYLGLVSFAESRERVVPVKCHANRACVSASLQSPCPMAAPLPSFSNPYARRAQYCVWDD